MIRAACQLAREHAWRTLLVTLVCAICADAQEVVPLSEWHYGESTFYGGAPDRMDPNEPSFGTLEGSCGYGLMDKTIWPYWSVGAFAPTNSFAVHGPIQACGQCFEVHCVPGGPNPCYDNPDDNNKVVIMITDTCPECTDAANRIDMQALTFAKMAPPSSGRVAVRFRRVVCRPPQDVHLQVLNATGSGGWLRLLTTGLAVTGGVSQVHIKHSHDSANAWMRMNNTWGAAWEVPVTPRFPLDVQITGDNGQQLEAGRLLERARTGIFNTQLQLSSLLMPVSAALVIPRESEVTIESIGTEFEVQPAMENCLLPVKLMSPIQSVFQAPSPSQSTPLAPATLIPIDSFIAAPGCDTARWQALTTAESPSSMPAAPDMAPIAQPAPAAVLPDPADMPDLQQETIAPPRQTAPSELIPIVRHALPPAVMLPAVQRDKTLPKAPAPDGPSMSELTGSLRVSPISSLNFETADRK